MQAIFEINAGRRTPKYQQIINSVTKAIREGRYKVGDRICSINELSSECSLSRDTVQRAYDLLEQQQIIEAVKGKGFYINRTDAMMCYRVLLIFNKISNYKKIIYDSFVQALGKKGAVDLRIHHSDSRVLKDILANEGSNYDYYIIMPHFYDQTAQAQEIIAEIPREKLIILDKDLAFDNWRCRGVFQDFENDIRNALITGIQALSKYRKLIYVQPATPHPDEIRNGFRRFCHEYNFPCEIIEELTLDHQISKGETYIVIEEQDLATLIKICRAKNLTVGKDIGIISYNDTPLKKLLLNGITVISTDHQKMGTTAAQMILEQRNDRIKIPFHLILRNSL